MHISSRSYRGILTRVPKILFFAGVTLVINLLFSPTIAFSQIAATRDREELPDFDTRAPSPTGGPLALAARDDGVASLQAEVKGAVVEHDDLHGSPAFVRSSSSFLTSAVASVRALVPQNAPVSPPRDPQTIVKEFIDRHQALFGHRSDLLDTARVQRDYITSQNGLHTIIWEQRLNDISIFGAVFQAHVTNRGELVNISSRFLASPQQAAQPTSLRALAGGSATISGREAVAAAARNVGEELTGAAVVPLNTPVGADLRQKFSAEPLSDAEAHYVWLPMNASSLRLCWEVTFFVNRRGEMFRLLIDATTGEAVVRNSLTNYISNASYRVFTSDSPSPFSPGYSTPLTTQPSTVARPLVTTSALDTTASPNGWIDDGVVETRGNNVDAHTDTNADNLPDLPRPQATGANRVFDPPLDLTQSPTGYRDAAVVNLFYWCNVMHDRLYQLGFTEAAGNFQNSNFGRGGVGNDAVQADAQDGSGFNNANFSTPSDGSPGRMQMYLFNGPSPARDADFDAEIILHEYTHGLSNRLVGGGVGINALVSRGMGEGWSDFYSMAILSEATDNVGGNYAAGAYSTYQLSGMTQNYYFGIRRYPYTTDLTKNPLTFKDIDPSQASVHSGVPTSPIIGGTANEVHNMGEVWCVTLWDARANLIAKHGFAIGNQLILQLVTDGMKLAPADPNFLQARDAILQADLVDNGGANRSELWAAFVKRGMGAHASAPSSSTTAGLVENFDVPDDLGISPTGAVVLSGTIGGPFKPATTSYTLTNSGAAALSWSASANVAWLDLTPSTGTITPGSSVTISLSPNLAANALATGNYPALVSLTNTTSGIAQIRSLELDVQPFTATIFSDTFESGTLDPTHWTTSGTNTWRTQVTNQNGPHAGNYHLTMDSYVDDSYSRNEATLTVNLNGEQGLVLTFWAKIFNDEPDGPPASPFTGGANFDGVAISADGNNWYEVQPLRSPTVSNTWAKFSVDLDAAIAAHGLNYNSSFKVRFNQYDNYGITTDGIAIDDVAIVRVINNRLSFTGPAMINENAGAATVTVTANPVPSADLTIALTSSLPTQLSVPTSVTIPAGQPSTTFSITPVDDTLLNGTRSVTLTGSAANWASATSLVALQDNETATLTLTLPSTTTEGATDVQGTVSLSAAPATDVVVQLTSDDTTAAVPPASVTIAAGQTSAKFDLFVPDNHRIEGNRSSTITASVANWISGQATIIIYDNESATLALNVSAAVREGDTGLTGSVQIPGTWPTDLVITLTSDDTTEITVPASVTIPAGQTAVNFPLTVVDDTAADGTQTVHLNATAASFAAASETITVADNDAHHFSISSVTPSLVRNKPFAITITALDVNNVPITNYNSSVTLAATSGSGAVAITPTNATGFVNGIWTGSVTASTFATGVTLTVSDAGGHTGTSNVFDVGTGPLDHFAWSPIGSPQTVDSPYAVTLTAQDVGNNTVNYSGAVSLATTPASLGPTVGTDTASWSLPMYTGYHDARTQVIYLASELGGAKRLSGLRLYVDTPGGITMNNWTIRLKPTTQSYFSTSAWEGSGWTIVQQSNLPAPTTAGWVTFNFSAPFDYDGVSNLIVDFSFNNSSNAGTWSACRSTYSNNYRTIYGYSNSTNGDPLTWAGVNGASPYTSGYVPNVQWLVSAQAVPIRPTVSGNFSNGVWTGTVSLPNAGLATTLTATASGGASGTSNAFDVITAGAPSLATVIFTEGFESGVFSNNWTITGTSNYRSQITTANGPHGGTHHLLMDSSSFGAYSRNESTLSIDLSGRAGVVLSFWAKIFNDAPNGPPPVPFTGGADFDGVAISADGITWWEVQPLRTPAISNNWTQFTVDLDAAMVAHGLTYTSAFKIRFNHYDAYSVSSAGMAVDDIAISALPLGAPLTITAPAQVTEGALGATGSITLPSAPSTPITVALTSNIPAKLAVPASVVVPAGQTTATFPLSLPDDTLVDGSRTAIISATATGYRPATTGVTILDNEIATLGLSVPSSLNEGASASATITATGNLAQPVTVTLTSSDPQHLAVPASVVLSLGNNTVQFTLSAPDNNKIEGAKSVIVTATVSGWVPATATVGVQDDENASLVVSIPTSLREGDAPKIGTVKIPGILGTGLAVTLTSSDTSEVTVPPTVTIPAGQTSATFALTVIDDPDADGPQPITITASASGFTSGQVNGTVRDNDAHHFTIATIGSPQVSTGPVPVIVTACDAAGAAIPDYNSTVTLSATSNAGALSITPSSTNGFVRGVWNGSVQFNATATNVVITISDSLGHTGASNAFSLTTGSIDHFAWNTIGSPQTVDTPFSASVRAVDQAGNTVTNYNGAANFYTLGASANPSIGNATSSLSAPFYTYGTDSRTDILYFASEIGGASRIAALAFDVISPTNQVLTNLTLRLKHSTKTNLGSISSWDNTGWTTVYQGSPTVSTAGLMTLPFSAPFDYDGASNLLVEISIDRSAISSTWTYVRGNGNTNAAYMLEGASYDGSAGDPLAWTTNPYPSAYWSKPNIVLTTVKELPVRPAQSGNFTNGVWTGQISVPTVGNGEALRARAGSLVGTSNSFDVSPSGATVNSAVVFADDFESGTFPTAWAITGTGSYHTINTTANGPHTGTHHMTMDVSTYTGAYARNEATLTLNLVGRTGVNLSFWARSYNDQPNGPPPSPFPNTGADFDGVAISADGGTNWYEVQGLRALTSTYTQYSVNLDSALAAHGLSYGNNFKIRFNQYGNDYIPYSGIGIDDVSITANPLAGLTLAAPLQVNENAGSATATATLDAVRQTDTAITLASSAPAKITVPPSLVIPAGQLNATFSLTVLDDTLLDGNRSVSISGTIAGSPPTAATVTVVDDDTGTLALSIPSSAAENAGTLQGVLSLTPAPVGVITVALVSSDPTAATVPASVTFQPGQTTAPFALTVIDDNKIDGPQTTTITASLAGSSPASADLTVNDNEAATLTLYGFSLTEGSTQQGYLYISGTMSNDLDVSLTSSLPGRLSVPTTVRIPAGLSSAAFTITAPDNNLTDGTQNISITATASGFSASTATGSVYDNDVHHFNISTVSSPATSSTPFSITVTAQDVNNSQITAFNGQVALSATSDAGPIALTPTTTGAFSSGYWSGTIAAAQAGTNVRIVAATNNAIGTSNAFTILAAPSLSVNPSSITLAVGTGGSTTRTLSLTNNGGKPLTWSIATSTSLIGNVVPGPEYLGKDAISEDKTNAHPSPPANVYTAPASGLSNNNFTTPPSLATVLTNLNFNAGLVRGSIPSRYSFSEGVTGTNINDGGNDMYDGGNFLDTSTAPGTYLNYSDNAIVSSTTLGTGGQYFTRKYDGFWVFAADISGLSYFETTGNLGADGSGATDTAVLTQVYGGVTYKGFVKRVYNAGDPSINHIIIVADNGTVTHSASTNTNDDYHRITGLAGATRIYYLLYAGTSGAYIDNTAAQTIMAAFIDALLTPSWLTPSVSSGTIPAGGTQNVVLTLGTPNLVNGTYTRPVVITSNDPLQPQTSIPVNLTVAAGPTITSQPVGETAALGATVTFSVAATASGPITYQWRKNGLALADGGKVTGATSATLQLANVAASDAGDYSVVVTNAAIEVNSAPATLSIGAAPSISAGPASQTVSAGAAATFTVTAQGTAPLSYQWNFGGTPISGATNATLVLSSVSSAVAGSYTVTVTNGFGNVTSTTATLTVTTPPPPPIIIPPPPPIIIIPPSPPPSATAPSITAQPSNITAVLGANATFAVTANGTSPLSYQWYKNGAAIQSAKGTSLTLSNIGVVDIGSYYVTVTNSAGSATSNTVTLQTPALAAPNITGAPTSRSIVEGETTTLSVTASGTGLTYQWQKNGLTIPGADSATLTLPNVKMSDGGAFSVVVSNIVGTVRSPSALLVVTPKASAPTIVAPPANVTTLSGNAVKFSVSASGTTPLTYQWRKDGTAISGATGASIQLNNIQPSDAGNYVVVVTNSLGTATSAPAILTITNNATAPTIVVQPISQSVPIGGIATFGVSVSGTAPFQYQWWKNGKALSGATSATFTVDVDHASDAGSYSVTITNSAGTVSSNIAVLMLITLTNAPVILTDVADVTAREGAQATFFVNATSSSPLIYQWLKNGIPLSGATNPTLTLKNVQSADQAFYAVVVSNSSGSATSRAASLNVQGHSYAGNYFGTFGVGGSFALTVHDDASAEFIGYANGSQIAFVDRNVSVDDSGHFQLSASATYSPATVSSFSESRAYHVAEASTTVTVTGTLALDGSLSGSVAGLNSSLAGTRAADTGSTRQFAGFYLAGASGSSAVTYTVIGGSGQAFSLTVTPTMVDGGPGTIDASGKISITTSNNTALTGNVTANGTTLTADISTAGGAKITVAGGGESRPEVEKLMNISTRNSVSGRDDVLIAGFVVNGDAPKPVLIRAVGPTLSALNVTGVLSNPHLELFNGPISVATNNAWDAVPNANDVATAAARAGAFTLAPGTRDAALLVTLAPGPYTAVVTGENNTSGVALIEVYDVAENAQPNQKVINISSRGVAGTGEKTLITGFVIRGSVPKRVLLRGVGPTLGIVGVTGALYDPQLRLYQGSTLLATNDNWGDAIEADQIARAAASVGAFALPPGSKDAALLINLVPGAYTLHIVGTNDTTGVALAEVYEVQQ